MGNLNNSMIALATLFGTLGLGWVTVHTVRVGWDYVSTRGNPRNRAQAHESARDIMIGAAIIIGAVAGAALIYSTIKV